MISVEYASRLLILSMRKASEIQSKTAITSRIINSFMFLLRSLAGIKNNTFSPYPSKKIINSNIQNFIIRIRLMAELGSEKEILGRDLKRYFSLLPNVHILILIAPMNSIKSIYCVISSTHYCTH